MKALGRCLLFIVLIALGHSAVALTTFDPLSIGVGARALGMGKAAVAMAESGDASFNNPAGLGEIDNFQFTSMSGKILEDVNYNLLGIIYPLGQKTAVGIAYVAANVSGIDLYDASGNFQKRADFGDSVVIASFGRKVSDKIAIGLNFKYFSQYSNELQTSNGSGANLDIGLLQDSLNWLTIGVVGKNILSASKIRSQNGEEENLPSSLTIGAKLYLLGNHFQAAILSPLELYLSSDAELALNSPQPSTLHSGVELSPNPNLSLRAGIDQDPIPGGVQNNFTAGISLKLAGIGFHYAYHPYGDLPQNLSHYFSLSFDEGGWLPEGPYDIYHAKKE